MSSDEHDIRSNAMLYNDRRQRHNVVTDSPPVSTSACRLHDISCIASVMTLAKWQLSCLLFLMLMHCSSCQFLRLWMHVVIVSDRLPHATQLAVCYAAVCLYTIVHSLHCNALSHCSIHVETCEVAYLCALEFLQLVKIVFMDWEFKSFWSFAWLVSITSVLCSCLSHTWYCKYLRIMQIHFG